MRLEESFGCVGVMSGVPGQTHPVLELVGRPHCEKVMGIPWSSRATGLSGWV